MGNLPRARKQEKSKIPPPKGPMDQKGLDYKADTPTAPMRNQKEQSFEVEATSGLPDKVIKKAKRPKATFGM